MRGTYQQVRRGAHLPTLETDMDHATDRLARHVETLPGYGAWLAEQDRDFWLGQLRAAALKHFRTLTCTCGGTGACEHCALDEALAYTAPTPPPAAA